MYNMDDHLENQLIVRIVMMKLFLMVLNQDLFDVKVEYLFLKMKKIFHLIKYIKLSFLFNDIFFLTNIIFKIQ
jgi:hypothetical protein